MKALYLLQLTYERKGLLTSKVIGWNSIADANETRPIFYYIEP